MKTTLTPILISITLLATGCELAGPLLIGEATSSDDDDIRSSSATLTVEIESASGTVAGRTIAPEMFSPTGERFGSDLTFHLATPDRDLEVLVMSQAEGSSTNPYTGESGGDFGGGGGRPIPSGGPDGTGSSLIEPFADVLVCESGFCRSATDFGVELVQTETGRLATVDGVWDADESVAISLRYTEN